MRCPRALFALTLILLTGCGESEFRHRPAELPSAVADPANLPPLPRHPIPTLARPTNDNLPWQVVTTTTRPPPAAPPTESFELRGDSLFDYDVADLKSDSEPELAKFASEIRRRGSTVFLHFVGHTDSSGTAGYNLDLSRRRALAVLEWFAAYGFDRSRLSYEGRGESDPIVDDEGGRNSAAAARNRRVEIKAWA